MTDGTRDVARGGDAERLAGAVADRRDGPGAARSDEHLPDVAWRVNRLPIPWLLAQGVSPRTTVG